jgi:DNA-binding NtrC family response regulator
MDIRAMFQTEVAAESMRSGLVLLVEDDALQLDAMVELVTDLGFTPQVFTNADEAFQFVQERPDEIRLLWTDFLTPGQITGGDLAVKALSMSPGLPIVVTSGAAGTAYKLVSGITYVSKPWSIEVLTRLILRLTAQQRATAAN